MCLFSIWSDSQHSSSCQCPSNHSVQLGLIKKHWGPTYAGPYLEFLVHSFCLNSLAPFIYFLVGILPFIMLLSALWQSPSSSEDNGSLAYRYNYLPETFGMGQWWISGIGLMSPPTQKHPTWWEKKANGQFFFIFSIAVTQFSAAKDANAFLKMIFKHFTCNSYCKAAGSTFTWRCLKTKPHRFSSPPGRFLNFI